MCFIDLHHWVYGQKNVMNIDTNPMLKMYECCINVIVLKNEYQWRNLCYISRYSNLKKITLDHQHYADF